MRTLTPLLASLLLATSAVAQDRPWQHISDPTSAQLADQFASPPSVYSAQFDFGFSTRLTAADMGKVLDRAKSVHVMNAYMEPTRGPNPYLSPEYFEAVKSLVAEARKRDMHLWFDDDGGYPSGFGGGKFTTDRPDLRMMALSSQRVAVTAGQNYAYKLEPGAICVVATNLDTSTRQVLDSSSGTVNWTVPVGNWKIDIPYFSYRSGPTRSANNGTGAKDATHSLMDFLSPEANQLFDHWTFDAYKAAIGDELGKTVLGFRGDEPAYGFNPWSPGIVAEFQKRKGYDIRPFLPAIASIRIGGIPRIPTARSARGPTTRGAAAGSAVARGTSPAFVAPGTINLDATHRAYADYCDVWSDLFGENFFGGEGKWAQANGVEMQMHIEHEEILPQLAMADGDFFKCMRSIQVPGIDTIWHQIWHDVPADFPKLASSATHLNGTPRAMCEAFAAYNPVPDLNEARWILNHLMVLGVNHIEYMGMGSSPTGGFRNFYADPGFPSTAAYINRVSYVLGEGRPAAQIGVYIPNSSFWFNDSAANTTFLSVVHELMEHQRDVDFIDDGNLATTLKLQGGALVNQSNQAYRAIVIPPSQAISKAALDNLHAFAQAGGKVVFLGAAPKLVVGNTFMDATGPADISWAMTQPSAEITEAVLAALPAPDVATDKPTTWLKYNHRRMKDADVYFFFNEGQEAMSLNTMIACGDKASQAEKWDGVSGTITPWAGASFSNGKATIPLELQAWGTKVVVIRD